MGAYLNTALLAIVTALQVAYMLGVRLGGSASNAKALRAELDAVKEEFRRHATGEKAWVADLQKRDHDLAKKLDEVPASLRQELLPRELAKAFFDESARERALIRAEVEAIRMSCVKCRR